MTCRVCIITIPVDEALKIDQRNACGGLAVQCIGVTGCTRRAVLRGLPVVVDLEMNPAITSRVFGCCAGRTIVGDNSRIIHVEGKIIDSRTAIRPTAVGWIITSRRVLKNRTRPLDTIDLNKDSLLISEIIGDGTGRTRRMPA